MTKERRKEKRHPCTSKIAIFLAKGANAAPESGILAGNLIDISLNGAGLSLPQILDKRVHLAYTAMESKELILHVILHHGTEQRVIIPVKPAWFNRTLSENMTPFRLGVEFTEPLSDKLLASLIQK